MHSVNPMHDAQKMPPDVDAGLAWVRRLMVDSLGDTVLARLQFDFSRFLGGGKLLRARAALRLAPVARVPADALLRGAAAVELVHGASLLHDDVIDGGLTRRGAPAFWTRYGAHGAILAGDILLGKALNVLSLTREPDLIADLAQAVAEVCSAESEQELLLRGQPSDWSTVLRLARQKTGPLFAFAALTAGNGDPALRAALREAGYLAGTAYQLSDDVLDAVGDATAAGKTLGTDVTRAKGTAATARNGDTADAVAGVGELCATSLAQLDAWPEVRAAWAVYLDLDLGPAMARNVHVVPPVTVP